MSSDYHTYVVLLFDSTLSYFCYQAFETGYLPLARLAAACRAARERGGAAEEEAALPRRHRDGHARVPAAEAPALGAVGNGKQKRGRC